MAVASSRQMKEIEARALDFGQTYLSLMQNAGERVSECVLSRLDGQDVSCVILCGKGNNGGDGFVVAENLHAKSLHVTAILPQGEPVTDEARIMYERARGAGVSILFYEQEKEKAEGILATCDVVVDALYGTGFHGELSKDIAALLTCANESGAMLFAVDIPSGVNADTGVCAQGAFRADVTVTFDCLKPAHLITSSKAYCGKVLLSDIGIDPRVHEEVALDHIHLSAPFVFSHIPRRKSDSHKGSFGRLLLVCGSVGMCGAAVLAATGALRCGAGLLTLTAPGELLIPLSIRLTEALLLPLCANDKGRTSKQELPRIKEALIKSDAALLGCGLGLDGDTGAIVEEVVRTASCPLVIDADGLNALISHIDILKESKAPLILTPHPGEMARLSGKTTAEVQADRYRIGRDFAREYRVTLVLKGADTMVFSPEGEVFFNSTGNPGLARGGSGDLLAGMIAAFLAQGLSPKMAACCGVFLHGAAADRCAARLSQYAMLPSDMMEDLGHLFAEYGR